MGDGRRGDELTDVDPPRPATRAVHAGEDESAPRRGAAGPPIHQTAPFVFETLGELERVFADRELPGLYSRSSNPSVRAVERKAAALEAAEDAVAFSSGMAAISGALSASLRSGDRLLVARETYGGTRHWLGWLAEHHPEIDVVYRFLEEIPAVVADIAPRMTLVESPTNPLLRCCDLGRLAEACHSVGAELVVDNTFATPILQRPLGLGADLVVHSATKFLAGHSDVTAGVVVGGRDRLEPVRRLVRAGGAVLDPHAAFLVARGMKTVALRVERQSETAARLAEVLRDHPAVGAVRYPGWDPVGRTQMAAGGGMVAFDLGSDNAVRRFLDGLRLVAIIPSLGGVESGVVVPAVTSHRAVPEEERRELGIGEGLVRLSCGIEDPDDLEADLRSALAPLPPASSGARP